MKELKDGAQWNRNSLPKQDDASSYDYTSARNSNGDLLVSGPHDSATTFIIGVYASTSMSYNIMGTFFQTPIILIEGTPQRHYVSEGQTEQYIFNVDRSDRDIMVTTTAITGDPDILISYNNNQPYCRQDSAGNSFTTHCGNYTWKANNYHDDQIVINHLDPCSGSSDENCVGDDIFAQGVFYIGTYGFENSEFSIVVNYVGGVTTLVGGQPQTGETAASTVCKRRDSQGFCVGDDAHDAQVAYFDYRLGSDDWGRAGTHVSFGVTPKCSEEDGGYTNPGCEDGGKLTVFIKVCVEDEGQESEAGICTVQDMYPTEDNCDLMEVVEGGERSTVFIANDPAHPGLPGTCNPIKLGGKCVYYIAVEGIEDIYDVAKFDIVAQTPSNIGVIPCRPSPGEGKRGAKDGMSVATTVYCVTV